MERLTPRKSSLFRKLLKHWVSKGKHHLDERINSLAFTGGQILLPFYFAGTSFLCLLPVYKNAFLPLRWFFSYILIRRSASAYASSAFGWEKIEKKSMLNGVLP